MRNITSFIILFFLSISCFLKKNNSFDYDIMNHKECQAVKILLDNVTSKELKNDKFVVIICESSTFPINYEPRDIILWFKYSYDKKYIIVNYLTFPNKEIQSSINNERVEMLDDYIAGIIQNKKIIQSEKIKQLEILLPLGLQNDKLLQKMRKDKRYTVNIDESSHFYYWGIKTAKNELIARKYDYGSELLHQIEDEFLEAITTPVFYHETSNEWKKEWDALNYEWDLEALKNEEYGEFRKKQKEEFKKKLEKYGIFDEYREQSH